MATFDGVKSVLMTAVIGFIGSAFGIGAPTGLAVAPIDYTQAACNIDCSARLSWTAPAEGTPTGYKVYRRLAAHEHPTLAGSVGADATSFTDSTATVGALYSYTVTAVDGDGESAESTALTYRRVKRVSGADCGAWSITEGSVDTANKFTLAGLYDGTTTTGTRSHEWTTYADTFSKPTILSAVRVLRPADYWGTAQGSYYLKGYKAGSSEVVNFVKAASDQSSTLIDTTGNGTWEVHATHADYAETTFSMVTIRSAPAYFSFFNEIEYYGYQPSALLSNAPVIKAPTLGDSEVLISWAPVEQAVSYSVYRKAGEGAWETVAQGLTALDYRDAGLTPGATYTYRVASVVANGDEESAEEGVTVTAVATADSRVAFDLTVLPFDFTQASCNLDCNPTLSWSLLTSSSYDKVRVYRFLKGHEDETPAPIATLDKAMTTYTDTGAIAGQPYAYRVACYDSATDTEGPLSDVVECIKVENMVAASKGNVTLNSPNLENGAVANVNDGNVNNNAVCKGNSDSSLIVLTFKEGRRPRLVHVRLNFGSWGTGNVSQKFYGAVMRNGSEVQTEFNGVTSISYHTFTQGAWNQFPVAASLQNDVWSKFTFGGGNYYGNCREVEAYGYIPGETPAGALSAPALNNPEAGRRSVSLSWTVAANAVSYKVYRKVADGAWELALADVTGTSAVDEGATFDGTTYIYRVAAVAANGDELSSEQKTVLCPVGAPFWWNFLNVKSVAFPGAAAYANPSQVKPHFMSRDKAGTLLAVPMSTDNGTHPAVTFDFAALASPDNLGELLMSGSGMKQYGIFTDFGGDIGCWKGAAVSDDLVVIGNGAAGSKIAVIERATGVCVKYRLLNGSGVETSYALDGGFDFDASGAYLYSNDGSAQNKIVKWQVDASAKTLKKVADYTATDFTRIRNLAIYSVGGAEYAFFGEGSAQTGKIGALKLADGSVTTLVTDATNLAGDIMNVKVAAADGETYVVAQLDTAAVGVYALDAATMTATLEKAIDAATMKALYGTADGGQYRNFEMTADGRYALIMNNAGAATRLVVIGANEPIIPSEAPTLTASSNFATQYKPTLSWTVPAGVDAESVRIFRGIVGKSGAAVLADLPLDTGAYIDETAVPSVPYAYSAAYIRRVNGQAIVGVRGAEVEATALIDLKTKKKAVLTSHDSAKGTVGNLFDDNTTTSHDHSTWEEMAAIQFTERVQLMACRYMPRNWGTIHRGDNLQVYGSTSSSWTQNRTRLGTGPVVEKAVWYDITLNGSAAAEEGWEYFVLASGYAAAPYLNLYEVDFYGISLAERAAALEEKCGAAREDAPVPTEASNHALTWTENGVLAGVVVRRSRTPDGSFVEIARLAPGAGEFHDETAIDGIVYYYQLAYLSEFEGVAYEGAASETIVDYGQRLDTTTYRSAILQDWTANWTGGYAFDDKTDTVVNGPNGGNYFGVAFKDPVVVNAIAVRGPEWSVNANGYRIDNLGIFAAPAGVSGIATTTQSGFLQITSAAVAEFVQIGTTPSGCHTANRWYATPTTSDAAWSYLYLYRANWYASISGLRIYGWPESTVEAAKASVVWPVEEVTARMDDTTLTLSWTLANTLATSITVMHRVSGGEWTEIATLKGDATTFTTDEVAIGRYNEYRLVMTDGNEVVWAEKDFAICPLLSKGTRTALGCNETQAWDYLTVDSAREFAATFKLAGSTQEMLGLTPGKGDGKAHNLYLRKSVDAPPAVQIQRHWVEGNTLGWYAYDAAAVQPGWNYWIEWSDENNPSTTFKINRSGTSYRLRTAATGEALADTANYTFVGDDHLDNGPCLVGVGISDPNLKTLSQIAPVEVKVHYPGLAIIVR